MNSLPIKFFMILSLLSFNNFAQLQNRSFEEWGQNGPTGWGTDDTLDFKPITRNGYAHEGNFAADGKVISVNKGGIQVVYTPLLFAPASATSLKDYGFHFTGRPKALIGYYNFTSIGNDKFKIIVQLQKGPGNPVAGGTFEVSSSTASGYHKFRVPLHYVVKNSVVYPTDMIIFIMTTDFFDNSQSGNVGTEFHVDDISPIEITKPKKNDVIISGEPDTLKWEDGAVSFVDIDYSLDNGATYTNVVTSCPDSDEYIWDVPKDLLSRYGKLRIRDNKDYSNKDVQSVVFKPWELTRYNVNEKGGLEAFTPDEDGWRYSNQKGGTMWPQYWWQKPTFNYQGGIDPFLHTGYPFEDPWAHARQSSFPDWPLWVDVFGIEQCYVDGIFSSGYNGQAVTAWNYYKDDTWKGSCFGFSISSLLAFNVLSSFHKIGDVGSELYSVPFIRDTGYTVDFYQTVWSSKEELTYTKSVMYNTDVQDLLADLKAMFRQPNGDGRALTVFTNNLTHWHTVVPYKLERINKTSTFFLSFYNSLHPGDTKQVFYIDSLHDTWSDITGGYGINRKEGIFLERESHNYLSTPTLPTPPSLNSNKSLPLSSPKSADTQTITIYNTGKANITISSNHGEQINYKDSTIDNKISNSIPIVPITGYFHPPIGYYLPKGEYSIHLSNFKDSSSYASFITDSTIYNYRRFDADSNETDNLIYSNGIKIQNPDASSKNINVQTIIDEKTSEKDFDTNNMQISQNDSINIKELDRKDLLLNNYGAGKNYDLHLRNASSNGEKLFFHSQVQLASNSAHRIVPDWQNIETNKVKILIDNDNDGTIDDSMFISNEITEIKGRNSSNIPMAFTLYQNYPNPFNPTTTIKYDVPKEADITLKVYNILGQEIATLVNGVKQTGSYEVEFDASKLSSGIYIYRLKTGEYTPTKKMILLK